MGLQAAVDTEAKLPLPVITQLVLDELDVDPSKASGPRTVKEKIALKHGIHLKR